MDKFERKIYMNKYRILFELQSPNETLEYYFAAKDDEVAQKYFLWKASDLIQKENLKYKKIQISSDGRELSAFFEKEVYFHGKLICMPTQYKVVDSKKLEQISMKSILQTMKRCCGSVNTDVFKKTS